MDRGVFEHIYEDMQDAGYEIRSLVLKDPQNPVDYVVEAEKYGIPQMRHRVILLESKRARGWIRNPRSSHEMSVRSALCGLQN